MLHQSQPKQGEQSAWVWPPRWCNTTLSLTCPRDDPHEAPGVKGVSARLVPSRACFQEHRSTVALERLPPAPVLRGVCQASLGAGLADQGHCRLVQLLHVLDVGNDAAVRGHKGRLGHSVANQRGLGHRQEGCRAHRFRTSSKPVAWLYHMLWCHKLSHGVDRPDRTAPHTHVRSAGALEACTTGGQCQGHARGGHASEVTAVHCSVCMWLVGCRARQLAAPVLKPLCAPAVVGRLASTHLHAASSASTLNGSSSCTPMFSVPVGGWMDGRGGGWQGGGSMDG